MQAKSPWPVDTRILLVEDNQINQLVATGILNDFGLSAEVAADGQEAIDNLVQAPEDAPYTLVFMDCQMPEMDGYEASRQIRAGAAGEHNKKIPIVAMTANAIQGDREKCLEAGMDDYIPKPINPNIVLEKLSQWLPSDITIKTNDKLAEHKTLPAQDNELDVWDQQAMYKRVLENDELMKTLINVYFDETPDRLAEVKKAVNNSDFENLRRVAHTIKGVAGNLSGHRLQHQAKEMEEAALQQDKEKIEQLLPVLYEASDQLKNAFEGFMSKV